MRIAILLAISLTACAGNPQLQSNDILLPGLLDLSLAHDHKRDTRCDTVNLVTGQLGLACVIASQGEKQPSLPYVKELERRGWKLLPEIAVAYDVLSHPEADRSIGCVGILWSNASGDPRLAISVMAKGYGCGPVP